MAGVPAPSLPPALAKLTAPPSPVATPGAALSAAGAAGAADARPPLDVLSLAQSRLGDLTTSMYTYLGILQAAAPPAGETMSEEARRTQEGLFEKAPEYAKEIGT